MVKTKDFDFLKLSKVDLSRPFDEKIKKRYRHGFSRLFKSYCFSCLLDEYEFVNEDELMSWIDKTEEERQEKEINEGKVTIEGQVSDDIVEGPYFNLDKIKESIFKENRTKKRFYERALDFHKKMTAKSSSPSLLKISLSIPNLCSDTYIDYDHFRRARLEHGENIHNSLALFLNLMRSRVVLQRISGYFWVVLRNDFNSLPYIHICFYIDGVFNEKLGAEISLLWNKCTKMQLKSQGDILNFTFTEHSSNNNVVAQYKSFMDITRILRKKDFPVLKQCIFLSDFNNRGFDSKHDNSIILGKFKVYASDLSREMYIQSASEKKRIETADSLLAPGQARKKTRANPPLPSRKKFRSCGFSGAK